MAAECSAAQTCVGNVGARSAQSEQRPDHSACPSSRHGLCCALGPDWHQERTSNMSQAIHVTGHGSAPRPSLADTHYQAFEILHWGFVAAPVLAGIDKFLGLLTNWDAYLAPAFA